MMYFILASLIYQRIAGLTMLREIQTDTFVLCRNAETEDHVHELQENECHDCRIHDGHEHRFDLNQELSRVSIEQSVKAGRVHSFRAPNTGCDGAPDTADAV